MHRSSCILFLSLVLATRTATLMAEQMPQDPAAAMAAVMAALGRATGQQADANAAVDPQAMKALLPAKDGIPGFKRTKLASQSNAAIGMKIVTASAEFQQLEGDGTLRIEFRDIGGLNTFAKAAMLIQEVDEETETGFRRTVTYDGFKGEEKYDNEEQSGSIALVTGDRINVEVSGKGVSFETLKAVLGKLDLKKLAALQPIVADANTNAATKPGE